MRILLTGCNGQLGTEVTRLLADSHHELIGVDLDNGERTLDITRRDLVLAACAEVEPDAVIHGAAFTAVDACEDDPDTAYRVNSLATRYVAEGARRVGAHVVYVSTDYVFDGTKATPYLEWDQPSPQSVYGRSKRGGELEIDGGWTIARTSWVCSAHGSNMLKTVLRLAGEHDELAFVDDQVGHPTFASDLAVKVVQLAVERAGGVFHVTNQGAVSWFQFVQAILEADGQDPARVRPIATADLDPPRPAPRPANSVLDNFALRASGLGELRHFAEPLAEAVAELRDG